MMEPVLSVVVVIVSDTVSGRPQSAHLSENLDALSRQECEIIVPYLPSTGGIGRLRERYPEVVFVPVSFGGRSMSREHHDRLRAVGLDRARGSLIALLEDHAVPAPNWAEALVRAHQNEHAAVGGAMENRIGHTLNWAVYFCDFSRYMNPVPEGESGFASDANVAYKRAALEATRDAWNDSFREAEVNHALAARGLTIALSPTVVVCQNRADLGLGEALLERYVWGRSYAVSRCRLITRRKRLVYAALAPLLPPLLVLRIARTVLAKGRAKGALLRALPLLLALTTGWAAGECAGYMRMPVPEP